MAIKARSQAAKTPPSVPVAYRTETPRTPTRLETNGNSIYQQVSFFIRPYKFLFSVNIKPFGSPIICSQKLTSFALFFTHYSHQTTFAYFIASYVQISSDLEKFALCATTGESECLFMHGMLVFAPKIRRTIFKNDWYIFSL